MERCLGKEMATHFRFLPEKIQSSWAGDSPWGRRELDTTWQLNYHHDLTGYWEQGGLVCVSIGGWTTLPLMVSTQF